VTVLTSITNPPPFYKESKTIIKNWSGQINKMMKEYWLMH
jgi:hypothetical protein